MIYEQSYDERRFRLLLFFISFYFYFVVRHNFLMIYTLFFSPHNVVHIVRSDRTILSIVWLIIIIIMHKHRFIALFVGHCRELLLCIIVACLILLNSHTKCILCIFLAWNHCVPSHLARTSHTHLGFQSKIYICIQLTFAVSSRYVTYLLYHLYTNTAMVDGRWSMTNNHYNG